MSHGMIGYSTLESSNLKSHVPLLTFLISQANATQTLASTMECARRNARENSNVIVPDLTREGNARKVWKKKKNPFSHAVVVVFGHIYIYNEQKWLQSIVLSSQVRKCVGKVHAGGVNVCWLQLPRSLNANAKSPSSLQIADMVRSISFVQTKQNTSFPQVSTVSESELSLLTVFLQSFTVWA